MADVAYLGDEASELYYAVPDRAVEPCCWHCTYPIEVAHGMPVRYEHGKFHTRGTFCSNRCVLAHIGEAHGPFEASRYRSIFFMRLESEGAPLDIIPAPSRFALKRFGGTMTIDDFKICKSYEAARTQRGVDTIPPAQ